MIHVRGQTRMNSKQKEKLQFRQSYKLLSNAVSAPVLVYDVINLL